MKTGHSRRRIALDSQTLAALRQHRVGQLAERLAADVAWQDTGAVFVALDGRELHPKSVSNGSPSTRGRAGSRPSGCTTSDIPTRRHSSSGEPITVVSRRLGHASVSITLDVYGHVLPTDDRNTAARTAAFILGR